MRIVVSVLKIDNFVPDNVLNMEVELLAENPVNKEQLHFQPKRPITLHKLRLYKKRCT